MFSNLVRITARTVYSIPGKPKRHGVVDWKIVEKKRAQSRCVLMPLYISVFFTTIWYMSSRLQVEAKKVNSELLSCNKPSAVLKFTSSKKLLDRTNYITAFHLLANTRYGKRGVDRLAVSVLSISPLQCWIHSVYAFASVFLSQNEKDKLSNINTYMIIDCRY